MIIAAAQFQSQAGQVALNVSRHVQFAEEAKRRGAGLLVFPELSLSGYEPALAEALQTDAGDEYFEPLRLCAQELALTVCAGMPLKTDGKPEIGMIIWHADGRVETHSKHILHEDELPFFSGGKRDLIISHGDMRLAPAICYESVQASHADAAHKRGANIYLASVAKPSGGMRKALTHYPAIAKQYGMAVIVANAVGPSDNFVAVGQSGAWTSGGTCVGVCDETEEALFLTNIADGSVQIVNEPVAGCLA